MCVCMCEAVPRSYFDECSILHPFTPTLPLNRQKKNKEERLYSSGTGAPSTTSLPPWSFHILSELIDNPDNDWREICVEERGEEGKGEDRERQERESVRSSYPTRFQKKEGSTNDEEEGGVRRREFDHPERHKERERESGGRGRGGVFLSHMSNCSKSSSAF